MKNEIETSNKNVDSYQRRLVVSSVKLKGVKIIRVDETWVAKQTEGDGDSNG